LGVVPTATGSADEPSHVSSVRTTISAKCKCVTMGCLASDEESTRRKRLNRLWRQDGTHTCGWAGWSIIHARRPRRGDCRLREELVEAGLLLVDLELWHDSTNDQGLSASRHRVIHGTRFVPYVAHLSSLAGRSCRWATLLSSLACAFALPLPRGPLLSEEGPVVMLTRCPRQALRLQVRQEHKSAYGRVIRWGERRPALHKGRKGQRGDGANCKRLKTRLV
jgi:hypothetical protein